MVAAYPRLVEAGVETDPEVVGNMESDEYGREGALVESAGSSSSVTLLMTEGACLRRHASFVYLSNALLVELALYDNVIVPALVGFQSKHAVLLKSHVRK